MNKIITGDCNKHLAKLPKSDIIFADPPFNIGQNYGNYHDNIPWRQYVDWTWDYVRSAWANLAPNGILCLHGPDDLADIWIDIQNSRMKGLPNRTHRIGWCNWHYRFGQNNNGAKSFGDSRCHLLVYAKSPSKCTWNPEAVKVDSDRKTIYKDRRTDADSENYEGGGTRLPLTVWGIPSDGKYWSRVTGSKSNKERVPGRPNQLPEKYLERIILAYSNEGDQFTDIFCGTGTGVVVADALSRDYIGIDIDKGATAATRKRLKKGAVRIDGKKTKEETGKSKS